MSTDHKSKQVTVYVDTTQDVHCLPSNVDTQRILNSAFHQHEITLI